MSDNLRISVMIYYVLKQRCIQYIFGLHYKQIRLKIAKVHKVTIYSFK